MSIVNIYLAEEDYVTRADLVLGDFFEFRDSIWICTEDGDKYNPSRRSAQAVDLSDGCAGEFVDDQLLKYVPRIEIQAL